MIKQSFQYENWTCQTEAGNISSNSNSVAQNWQKQKPYNQTDSFLIQAFTIQEVKFLLYTLLLYF